MFTRLSKILMNTPLAEGIPMGKSPLDRGDFFIFYILIELRLKPNFARNQKCNFMAEPAAASFPDQQIGYHRE